MAFATALRSMVPSHPESGTPEAASIRSIGRSGVRQMEPPRQRTLRVMNKSQSKPVVRRERLMHRIEVLAEMTEPDRPFTRRAFSELYDHARAWLTGEFASAGLEVTIDAGGNLVGERSGAGASRKPAWALGSHIDTVVGGGRYDGMVGVVAALEVAQVLHEAGVELVRPLRVIDFLSEEPSDFGAFFVGSQALAGSLSASDLAGTNAHGETLEDAIARVGGRPDALIGPLVQPEELAGFLELHIEQGPVLEQEGVSIGIVTGIAGITAKTIRIEGHPTHAGTTPMAGRRDALEAAAELVIAVAENARRKASSAPFVATVGKLDLTPNATNVVPGRVDVVVEARSTEISVVEEFFERVVEKKLRELEERGFGTNTTPRGHAPAVACAPLIVDAMTEACAAQGRSFRKIVSGAGHDAMIVARLAPVGMLFIPCRNGVSHNPAEWATEDDIEAGAQTLLDSLLRLDGSV